MASQNVEAFRALHEAFNRRDFDGVVSKMAEGFTYRDQARNVTFTGRNGFKEFMQGWAGAFSNAAVTDPSYLDASDTVIAQFMGQGVNDGAFGPLPRPVGRSTFLSASSCVSTRVARSYPGASIMTSSR